MKKENLKGPWYGQMDFLSQRQRLEMRWPQPEADRNTQKKNTVVSKKQGFIALSLDEKFYWFCQG